MPSWNYCRICGSYRTRLMWKLMLHRRRKHYPEG
jgi:hypothetical protein